MDFLPDSMSLLYWSVFIGPFVQEDAAVLYAASLSITNMERTAPLFFVIWLGLCASDFWKYWIGWAALRNERARAFTEKKHVADLKDKVIQHAFTTLMLARFVPLTRIPAYVACGLFGVNYLKYCLIIAFTAFLYVSAVFATFHLLGAVLGEQLKWILPIIALFGMGTYLGYLALKARKNGSE